LSECKSCLMKVISTLFLFSFFINTVFGQAVAGNFSRPDKTKHHSKSEKINLNGQWRGSFNESGAIRTLMGAGSETSYVLELEVKGSAVSGYSYTYFTDIGPKRYFTICRIAGTFDRETESMVVTEVERIKYNTPPEILNCFQVHRLRYEKGPGNTEYLKGDWYPAPNQNCGGKGETVLSREKMTRTPFAVKIPPKSNVTAQSRKPAPEKKQPARAVPAQPKNETAQVPPRTKSVTTEIPVERPAEKTHVDKELKLEYPPAPVYKGFEKRKSEVVKSINIENAVFQVDFYDNGVIDGDSISVFYNGKLILSNKMLTAQPLTLTLSVDKNYKYNTLTMYAENLGSIPPNTALMIVRDGNKRYEVRMESSLTKSGTVTFTHDE